MTTGCKFRLTRHLVPSKAAVAAMVSAAAISGCATSESPLATPMSHRPDQMADTFDAAEPDVATHTTPKAAPGALPDAPTNALPAAASHDELARLLGEGEAAYRARRYDEALAAFQRVVSIDSAQAQAWLRLGNLHHRRGKWFEALSAYRRVAARGSGDGVDTAVRAKAHYNLALINLELARQSLRILERIGPAAAAADEREPLSAAVQSARRRLDAFGEKAVPAPRPAARADAPRRSASRPGSGAQAELPRIDYFRGAPKP